MAIIILSMTNKYKSILEYLDEGKITTPERIKFRAGSSKFDISFKFSLSYDWSNGVYATSVKPTTISIQDVQTKQIRDIACDTTEGNDIMTLLQSAVETAYAQQRRRTT